MKSMTLILLMFLCTVIMGDDWNNNRKGIQAYHKKQSDKAIKYFNNVLQNQPDNPDIYYNLADAYYQQGNYEQAEKLYRKALETTDLKQKSRVWNNLGNTFAKTNKNQEALQAYKNSLKINPGYQDARYNYEIVKRKLKQQKQNQKNKNNQKDKKNDQNKKNRNDKQKPNGQDKNQKQNQQKKNESKQQNQKKQQSKMNKKTAEQLLEALKQKEKKNQKKLRAVKGKPVKVEKDW